LKTAFKPFMTVVAKPNSKFFTPLRAKKELEKIEQEWAV
jgi:hypothetical protein